MLRIFTNPLSILTLSKAIFPGEHGLVSFIAAKDDGGDVDNCSYKTCKAPIKSSLLTNQHPTFYKPDALPVAQLAVSTHWREKDHIPRTCSPQAQMGSSNFVSDH